MSRGFSWGWGLKKSAHTRNRCRVFLFYTRVNGGTSYFKDNNGQLWLEVFSVIFLDAVATTDVSTGSNKDVKLVKTWTVNFA